MKKVLSIFALLLSFNSFSQEKNYQEFSYSELFQMIEAETDSVFELSDAIITYNEATDTLFSTYSRNFFSSDFNRTDTLVINKELKFNSVFFYDQPDFRANSSGTLNHIKFLKKVEFFNSAFNVIVNSTFHEKVRIHDDESFYEELETLLLRNKSGFSHVFVSCHFKKGITYFSNDVSEKPKVLFFEVYNSIIQTTNTASEDNHTLVRMGNHLGLTFINNVFIGPGNVRFITKTTMQFIVEGNNLSEQGLYLIVPKEEVEELIIKNNSIGKISSVSLESYSNNYNIGWRQFKGKIADWNNYNHFQLLSKVQIDSTKKPLISLFEDREAFLATFFDSLRIQNEDVYKGEIAFRSKFLKIYRERYDTDLYNLVFTEIKDLETERLEYLHNVAPTFKTFFTWKINHFLKIFSAYGTEPARAIIFSLYVILAFALIYLLFPNSWDAHGKNRIVDRYRFFFKYLQRNAGMHEVYLEEKQQDLLAYEEFKSIITHSEKSVPRFFSATALPLYRWAVSGTRLSARLLSKIDVLKGTWEDLPPAQKAWKSFLLVGAFLVALIYDLMIKVLNALMLSINTFTTLGFGEIPIKGLPRYLAIIQGFIGWFMLTIFSVSLISQLLN